MRALIVDDEALARDRLRTMLEDHPDVEVVGEAGRAEEAIRLIRAERPDLVFLDVEMPGPDGFHVIDSMSVTPAPFVIFVTAHADHAVRAFDRAAGDYLLKPYDDRRLAKAVDRARVALEGRRELLERIPVTIGRRTIFVDVTSIDWIDARDNYACLHVGPQQHLIRETLTALESALDPKAFVRIHRSTIIRFDRIRELRHLGLGEQAVVLADGTELPVSEKYRDRISLR